MSVRLDAKDYAVRLRITTDPPPLGGCRNAAACSQSQSERAKAARTRTEHALLEVYLRSCHCFCSANTVQVSACASQSTIASEHELALQDFVARRHGKAFAITDTQTTHIPRESSRNKLQLAHNGLGPIPLNSSPTRCPSVSSSKLCPSWCESSRREIWA